MKTFAILSLLLFQVVISFAQALDTAKVENIDTLAKQRALFVMDGIALTKPYHLNPDSIIDIIIIKREKAREWFGGDPQNDLVILTSMRRGVKDYQKKFSAFSERYKAYLQTHKNDDKNVLYVLNGVILDIKDRNEMIRKLYKISNNNLKKVGYSDNYVDGMKRGATIFITTKQYH